jgi:hypothetical protein
MFMNLKIKSSQSFRSVHMGKMYIHIFIRISNHTCINIYVSTVDIYFCHDNFACKRATLQSSFSAPSLDGMIEYKSSDVLLNATARQLSC